MNFKINLIYIIKLFFYMTKSRGKNWNLLRMKRAFKVKQKAFLVVFKGLSFVKNGLKPWGAHLKLIEFSNSDA